MLPCVVDGTERLADGRSDLADALHYCSYAQVTFHALEKGHTNAQAFEDAVRRAEADTDTEMLLLAASPVLGALTHASQTNPNHNHNVGLHAPDAALRDAQGRGRL